MLISIQLMDIYQFTDRVCVSLHFNCKLHCLYIVRDLPKYAIHVVSDDNTNRKVILENGEICTNHGLPILPASFAASRKHQGIKFVGDKIMTCGGWNGGNGQVNGYSCGLMLRDGSIVYTEPTAGRAFGAYPNILEIQGETYITGYTNVVYGQWNTVSGSSMDVMKLNPTDLTWTLIKRQAPAFPYIRYSVCVVVRETIILYIGGKNLQESPTFNSKYVYKFDVSQPGSSIMLLNSMNNQHRYPICETVTMENEGYGVLCITNGGSPIIPEFLKLDLENDPWPAWKLLDPLPTSSGNAFLFNMPPAETKKLYVYHTCTPHFFLFFLPLWAKVRSTMHYAKSCFT